MNQYLDASGALSVAPEMNPVDCKPVDSPHGWNHRVFSVQQDGLDVGREVRTTFPSTGPMGVEEITISHMVTRHRSREVEVDRFTVQTERFLKENAMFLRGCYLVIDEANVHLSLVGFNGAEWERVEENLDTVESNLTRAPALLPLKGTEIVGYQLNARLKTFALSEKSIVSAQPIPWYTPKLNLPVSLDFAAEKNDTISAHGKQITGAWVSALRSGTDRVVVEIFVGDDGVVYQEKYPSLHQVRTLTENGFSIPTAYSDPYRGLFSNAYLGFADGSTDATYQIVSTQPISVRQFSFIEEPENQTLSQVDPHTLALKVTAGGPDGNIPPTERDLSNTKYINTDEKIIKDALIYLKSGGKRGELPAHRRDNAVPVIAKSVRIQNTKKFWSDTDKVARLIEEYVNAILPTKYHTHTMMDAVSTLKNGDGDCTEHSVLYASLMRAAKIPTRLVSGMYLTHGGVWVFHMWNEYWDGAKWKSVDTAVGPKMSTGANYVALSKGASNFEDHRHNISFFLDRSYSGLEINLIAAGANGEELHLARPKRKAPAGNDAIIVQALTLSRRGDYSSAFNLVDENYSPDNSSLNLALLRMELLYRTGQFDRALDAIHALREKTSLPANVYLMDKLEFDIYVAQIAPDSATRLLSKMTEYLDENSSMVLNMRASLSIARGNILEGLQIIENALVTEPYDTMLMTAYIDIVSRNMQQIPAKIRQKSIDMAWQALYLTHYASPEALKAVSSLFFFTGESEKALPIIEHALVMTPNDHELVHWHKLVRSNCR